MVRRYYDLPSLTGLAVFEASARHGSFKLAAAELNVTPGAVSRQIKSVEDELGVVLFRRVPGGVELTSGGEDLYAVLASGFSRVSEVVQNIKRGDRSRNVTVACSDAFASMWLMPRMGDFWRRFPSIAVDHLISDNARDYRRAEVDLRVRYGFGSWIDETSQLLFDETIYPVCGPDFAAAHADASPQDLGTCRCCMSTGWTRTGRAGTRSCAAPRSRTAPLAGRRFGKFAVALQAAQENQGVAIGLGPPGQARRRGRQARPLHRPHSCPRRAATT